MATIADPKLKSFDAEYVFQADTPQLDILSMVFGPHTQALAPLRPQQCEYLRERENPFFELALKAHSQRAYDEPSPRVLIGQLEPYSVIGKAKGLPFVSAASRMKSSYYSTLTWYEDDCSMEIWYNLVEDHSSSPIDELRMQSKQLYEPVYFSYDLCKGRSTYLLSHSIEPPNMTKPANIMGLHPFSGHLAVLCKEVEARSYAVARGLDTMLAIEQRWLEQPLLRTIDTYVIKTDLQSLHRVARLFIACEHRTGRDLSHVDKLLQDLDRLMVETTKHPHFAQLNSYLHERTKDGFYSLKDSCENIVRRMQTRRMRISNLINLLFNLTSNQDSATTISMSRDMSKDSAAMRTIATLSMFFLPATLITSVFGNNFYALSVNSAGGADLIISGYWWIYLLVIFALTLVASVSWVLWIKRRSDSATRSKDGYPREEKEVHLEEP